MAKHTFGKMTVIGDKTYFAGEAELSETEMKALGKSAEVQPEESAAFPEDYPGFEVLGAVEGMTREKLEAMSDDDILKIKGIGKKTLEDIRAYK